MRFENKVSVVMPTYNGSNFIERAISSILNQTFSDFEFIIIDDGSNDDTAARIKKFSDRRIKYIFQKNSGPASAYNAGFKSASTDFVFIMDHDDYSYPTRFEKQLDNMLFNELDICGSFFEIIESEHGFIEKKNLVINHEDIKRELLFRPWTLFNPTLCIRQSVFANYGLFDEQLEAGYDYDYLLRVADNVKCGNVPELLYQWTLHKKSHGWQKKGKGNQHFQNISIKKINSDQTKLPISEKKFCEGMVYYYANSFFKASGCFLKSIFIGNLKRKVLLYFVLSTVLSPIVFLIRRQQLFSHPIIIKLKSVVNGIH